MKRLSSEQIERIVALRERGISSYGIGCRLGLALGTVNYQLLLAGIDPFDRPTNGRARHPGAFSSDEDNQLLALATSGMKLPAIATAMNRARTSVRLRLMLLEIRAEKALEAA